MVIDGIQHRKKSFFNLQGVLLLRLRLLLALIIFLQAITFFSLKTLRKKALVTPLFYFLHHVWLFFLIFLGKQVTNVIHYFLTKTYIVLIL